MAVGSHPAALGVAPSSGAQTTTVSAYSPLSSVLDLSAPPTQAHGAFQPMGQRSLITPSSFNSNPDIVELQRTSERHDKLLEDMRSKLDLLVEKLTSPPPPADSLIPPSQTPHPSREGSPGRGRVVPGEEPTPGGDEPYSPTHPSIDFKRSQVSSPLFEGDSPSSSHQSIPL